MNTFPTTNASKFTQCIIDTSLYDLREITQSLSGARGSLSKIQRAALHWQQWEELHESLVVSTLQGIVEAQSAPDTPFSLPVVDPENKCRIDDSDGNCARVAAARTLFVGPLLPFDTLMMQMPLPVMLQIATAASLAFTHYVYQSGAAAIPPLTCTLVQTALPVEQPSLSDLRTAHRTQPYSVSDINKLPVGVSQKLHCSRKLRLGFISFDFNDHPTAHLIDAIFHVVRSFQGNDDNSDFSSNITVAGPANHSNTIHSMQNVELIIFSYGKDDNSQYRARLQRMAHVFIDVVNYSFQQATEAIRAQQIDILLDLQIHTLGEYIVFTRTLFYSAIIL